MDWIVFFLLRREAEFMRAMEKHVPGFTECMQYTQFDEYNAIL